MKFEADRRSPWPRAGFLGAGIAAVALALGLPVLAGSQAGPFAVSVTTSPNPYALEGTTSVANSVGVLGYATATTTVALEGYATQPGSTGLEGFQQATSGTIGDGVFGYAANGVGIYGLGASSYPAVFGTNTGGGQAIAGKAASNAVVGTSTAANGVVGITSGAPGSSAVAGVLGEDQSTAQGGAFGVYGTSPAGTAVYGESSTSGTGVEGVASGTSGTGIEAVANTSGTTALTIDANGGSLPIVVNGTSGAAMSLDASGNMILAGTLEQQETPLSSMRDAAGVRHTTYSSQQTRATLEDFGEARALSGRAYVALAPPFASLLDPAARYLVFVTPHGPNSGFYVDEQTARGFMVHLNASASTIDFDYRIVGVPRTARAQLTRTALERRPFRAAAPDVVAAPKAIATPFVHVPKAVR